MATAWAESTGWKEKPSLPGTVVVAEGPMKTASAAKTTRSVAKADEFTMVCPSDGLSDAGLGAEESIDVLHTTSVLRQYRTHWNTQQQMLQQQMIMLQQQQNASTASPLCRRDLEEMLTSLRDHLDHKLYALDSRLDKISDEQGVQGEILKKTRALQASPLSSAVRSPSPTFDAAVKQMSHGVPEVCIAVGADQQVRTEAESPVPTEGKEEGENEDAEAEIVEEVKHRLSEVHIDGETTTERYCRIFGDFVRSHHFDHVMGGAIVLNTIITGIQIDLKARSLMRDVTTHTEDFIFDIIESIFVYVFLVEAILRLSYIGKSYLLSMWGVFDIFICLSAMIEEAFKYGIAGEGNSALGELSALRILKVMKLVRALRVFRVMKTFRELNMVLSSVWKGMRALLWTLIFLFVCMYFMGMVILLEMTGADKNPYLPDTSVAHAALRARWFSSYPRTMTTVFQSFTGGVSWEEAAAATEAVSEFLIIIWLIFIVFTAMAVLNTVTGIFVDQAMKTAGDNSSEELECKKKQIFKRYLQQALMMADKGKGRINRDALHSVLNDPKVRKECGEADVDVKDVKRLFDLVNINAVGGGISLDELEIFLEHIFRLKGYARNADIAAMSFRFSAQHIVIPHQSRAGVAHKRVA
eukprot:TRINITY_DN1775_c4_g1_i1.p1 TRINITY_DN1775_c4_g1~~TRINITY_DN1775_c4_g1_i1.p1  ORF type:complete len:640 (-),score=151.67 TRINITY_DN1775_c4_g1_i1:124-2043(-)